MLSSSLTIEWLVFVSGGVVMTGGATAKYSGRPNRVYDTELIVNISSETKSLSGQVDSAIS